MLFRTVNRNKMSIVLDLRTEQGKRDVIDQAPKCDIALENFRPGTLERWGGFPSNPAGDAVQLHRVSAINCAHLDAGQPAPGRMTSIRTALDSARSDRTIRYAEQYQVIAAGPPTSGSTAALFGCRDAVLLVLAGAGLPCRAIAGLDRTDITTDGDNVWIEGGHRIGITPLRRRRVRPGRDMGSAAHGPAVSERSPLDGAAGVSCEAQHGS